MPVYVTLYKMTGKGAREVKQIPARIETGIKAAESAGIKVLGFYAVLGEYDYVGIGEAPSDEVAATFFLSLMSQGNVKTTTMRAFTVDELAEIIKKVP